MHSLSGIQKSNCDDGSFMQKFPFPCYFCKEKNLEKYSQMLYIQRLMTKHRYH